MFSYSDYIEERVRAKTLAEAAAEAAADKQKALEEEKRKTLSDVAVKMLWQGFSTEGVHEITGMAMSAIDNLRAQMNRSVSPSGMAAPT